MWSSYLSNGSSNKKKCDPDRDGAGRYYVNNEGTEIFCALVDNNCSAVDHNHPQARCVEIGQDIGKPDVLIIPGSKQTIKDLKILNKSGLSNQIKDYAKNGGNVFGICGGLQMLGKSLEDPHNQEGFNEISKSSKIGLNLLPIKTTFGEIKHTSQREEIISESILFIKSLFP